MASLKKFKFGQVNAILRHDGRDNQHYRNVDIDVNRSGDNYSLIPDRQTGRECYDYFLQRKSELACMDRQDINVLATWIITLPKDCPAERSRDFFGGCYRFLSARYGDKNTVSAFVHQDEGGMPHLHFSFIPTVMKRGYTDKERIIAEFRAAHPGASKAECVKETGISKKTVYRYWDCRSVDERETICANDRLDKRELVFFHPLLQDYLKKQAIPGTVLSGITKSQGGNRTVKELKQVDARLLEENRQLKKQLEKMREAGISRWQNHDVEIERTENGW